MSDLSIVDRGARGDGTTLCHEYIQDAIDSAARSGGGRVVVPPGTYLCGTIRLRSKVELYLSSGAVIRSADREELFPEICKTPHGNLPGQIQALLWADDTEGATISGRGAIDGAHPEALSGRDAAPIRFRPVLVFCRNCRDLAFRDVTLCNSSFWTLHLQRCDGVSVRGITILNNLHRINADGIDPDGCRNVTISDCRIESGDDCICLKSTEGDACEHITISNCILSTTCAAIKLGTEAIGPIRNVVVSNCVVCESAVGIALYMKDGSLYSNVLFSNIVIDSSGHFPILVDITPRYHREPTIGRIESVAFDTILISSPGRFFLEGHPESPIRNLSITNLGWRVTGPLATGIRKPTGARRTDPDSGAPDYAEEPFQLVAVHVDGLTIRDFRVTGSDLDSRKRFRLHRVTGAAVSGFSRWGAGATESVEESLEVEIG